MEVCLLEAFEFRRPTVAFAGQRADGMGCIARHLGISWLSSGQELSERNG